MFDGQIENGIERPYIMKIFKKKIDRKIFDRKERVRYLEGHTQRKRKKTESFFDGV